MISVYRRSLFPCIEVVRECSLPELYIFHRDVISVLTIVNPQWYMWYIQLTIMTDCYHYACVHWVHTRTSQRRHQSQITMATINLLSPTSRSGFLCFRKQDFVPMLDQWWTTSTTLTQHWDNVSCLLGFPYHIYTAHTKTVSSTSTYQSSTYLSTFFLSPRH